MSFTPPIRITKPAALLTLVGLWAFAVWSSDLMAAEDAPSAQSVIETRKAGLKKMGAAMKAIGAQLKSGAPDMTIMATAAQAISNGAQQQPTWFPAGSGPESGVETDALPNIWKDRAKFDSITTQLIAESKNLSGAIAGKDVATIAAQVKVVGETCGTCHRSFRAD